MPQPGLPDWVEVLRLGAGGGETGGQGERQAQDHQREAVAGKIGQLMELQDIVEVDVQEGGQEDRRHADQQGWRVASLHG
ncbi:MAG: hypothetical protein A2087_13140 [Spirochaetes bacterium GWD1_61_31]|nr:MAG: hypothetical protein A2Y37_02545 [Spirochaetes bacterium GWB1_60_80]OHD28584.1 MAG: hypothetical protein A2004_03120 [Spirochaetes bacterium GWC1_61_12]OHD39441.1 MAG: hypothetical protein A2087_13140 [Spirochaetes bacterium GWD1_61_31]OHD45494.1 MAG: hypothetical protein A2Y35_02815 [Spirochaetes bacterium GWE1_60_18]OHD58068.1 MAG: hypothetical protein A2Y32_05390 [Spirochaetes bacterium GWF1_60_12]HAP44635.1 hypothetical protein [Spirochaetaceae bacterium]